MLAYDFRVFPDLFYTRAELARAAGNAAEARRFYDLFLLFAGDRAGRDGRITRARSAARL